MSFWTDKEGNELTFKQFMARWKEGMKNINPYQQTKSQLISTWIMLVGIIAGLVITIYTFETLWWLTIILAGGTFNTLIQILGLWQKKEQLKPYYKKNG